MANVTLNCNHCGGPVQYDGSDVPIVVCPFCGTNVVIPQELRPVKPMIIEVQAPPVYQPVYEPAPTARVNRKAIGWIVAGVVAFSLICFAVTTLAPLLIAQQATQSITGQVFDAVTAVSKVTSAAPTRTTIPAATRAPSPTPGYELPGIVFGEKGINPGQMDDSRLISTDGSSTIFVANYSGGRVQAFDLNGKYLYQWKVGNSKTTIQGLAADRQGGVFISFDNSISRVDGKTGAVLGKLTNPRGGEFGSLAMTPDGSLAAVWYEGRWGIITSLKGHTEDIVFFNPSGKLTKTWTTPISNQTDDVVLDVSIAVDGKGNLFALSEDSVYAFNAEGKYINMFSGGDSKDTGQLDNANAICTDKLGQVVVGASSVVNVFSPAGKFVGAFQVKGVADGVAYDDHGSLWVLAYNQVTQFTRTEK
jgi:streptogramin lyase